MNISNQVSNAGFFYRIFILWEVLAGSYLVSKSLTSLGLLTTVYDWHLAYMYHFVMCIMHSCRYYTVYIIYDIDLVPNLGRRGHCDIVRTIVIL